MDKYLEKMKLNLRLTYIRAAFVSLMFFIPIWYVFETQYVSPAMLGTIYAVSHLLTVILELPSGALADLIGRKKTIFIGLLLQGIVWIYISQARSANWLWTGYLLNAISVALISGADMALDFDSLKELGKEKEFSRLSSKVGLVFRMGLMAATFCGAYFYSLNKSLPYILMGISAIIGGLLTFFNTEPKIDTEKFTLKSYFRQTKEGVKQLTKSSYIKDLSIYYILVGGITWYFVYFLNLAFATEIGFTAEQRSWIFSLFFFLVALIIYFLAHSKILTRVRVYISFPLLMALGLIPGFWLTKAIALPFIFFVQLAGSARFSILGQYVNQEFESKYRATAISALNMAVSLFFVFTSLIGGKVIEAYGPGMMMTLLGVFGGMITIPITFILITKYRDLDKAK